jgi:hypothetical protein
MAVNPDLFWPQGGVKFLTANGNNYLSDQRGLFHNVLDADVAAMTTAGCVTHDPEVTIQPVSQYNVSPTLNTVTMYGQANVTNVVNSTTYVSRADGQLWGVLLADVAGLQAVGFSLESPYFTAPTTSQYGNG